MLKRITLNNYTTYFNKPTSIDFSATNYKFLENENVGSGRILKGALFVGQNASGKTNALNAIRLIFDLLTENVQINFAMLKSFYTSEQTYSLEYEFEIDGSTIIYFVKMSPAKIVEERLTVNDTKIIERQNKKGNFSMTGHVEVEEKGVPEGLPFLRQVYFNTQFYGDKVLEKWYRFIRNSVYLNCNAHTVVADSHNLTKTFSRNFLTVNGAKDYNDFFKKIHYSHSILYSKETPKSKRGGIQFRSTEDFASFKKDGTDVFVPEWMESTGNRSLLEIVPVILHATSNNCMVVVNEFSNDLHNELEESVLKYFYHYSKDSQLFFTSHSTNIINNALIRPDQIYSVRFEPENGTVLARFSDQAPREAQNTEKMYLNGVFDEVPHYAKVFKD